MLFGKHVNRYYIKYWYMFLGGIIALILVDIAQLEIPNNYGFLIDYIQTKTLTKELLGGIVRNVLIILVVMFTGRFLWRICIFGLAIRVEDDLRKRMFLHMESLSQSYFQINKTGAQMALYTNDLQTIRRSFGEGLIMLIDAVFLGGLSFYKMFCLNPILAIIAAVPMLILAGCGGIIGKYMDKKWGNRQKAYENLSDFTQENFSGITVIKAFVKEAKELRAFSKINKDNEKKNIEFVKAAVLLDVMITLLINVIMMIIVGIGSYLVINGTNGFSVGDLSRYISYFSTLLWPMMAMAQLINIVSQSKASLKRINKLMDEKPDVVDAPDVITNAELKGGISFNNVTFMYPLAEDAILHNVSFNIEPGETVGIIGHTGSGKTTIVDLLTRVYNVPENTIFIDGYDIMKLPIKQVRDLISYVPQDNFLFGDTVISNIGFSKQNISLEEAKHYATVAGVAEDIEGFKDKYYTILGERGVTLSGGQKQRISIARALVKDAKVLILDDSVSAVDTKTEATILHNLAEYNHKKTVILIAHRISTVINADKIILIDDGRILAVGKHEELLKNVPEYQETVRLQELESELTKEDI